MMDTIKKYAKAIAAFVMPIVGNMVADFFTNGVPIPQTSSDWIRYIVTTLLTAGTVYAVPNAITQKQIDKAKETVSGAVIGAVAETASNAAQNAVIEATKDIPLAGGVIENVTNQVGSVVDQVIRDFSGGRHAKKDQ